MQEYTNLLQGLGYKFKDDALLQRALTHRSHNSKHNERLEFLGDAVLQLVITDILFQQYGKLKEGPLSRIRSSLVSSESLATIAAEINLGDYVFVGKCERQNGNTLRESILADAVEALIAAIYVDSGLPAAKKVIQKLFADRLQKNLSLVETKDAKTLLQEFLQAQGLPLPKYTCVECSGAQHRQTFKMLCAIDGVAHQEEASAANRRKAEMLAAEKMLTYLKEQADG